MANVKARLNPAITAKGWPGFLLWARKERPAQYAELVTRVPIVADFESQVKNAGIGDVSDWFSGIGDALSSAGSTIANVFTTIAPAALNLGTTLIQAHAAQNLSDTQLKLAIAQKTPAQTAIYGTANGAVSTPVVRDASGNYVPATVNSAGQLVPMGGGFSLSSVPITTWLIGAGALAGILLLLKRR